MKYAAEESAFGSKNVGDLPVDSHELIALCAPRPTFINYGLPELGDAPWLDQQGSYMAATAAGDVTAIAAIDEFERAEYAREPFDAGGWSPRIAVGDTLYPAPRSSRPS